MTEDKDIQRLREEYRSRETRLKESDIYALSNPAHLFMIQQRERAILKLLRKKGLEFLVEKQILEIGCGKGTVLLDFVRQGADPERLWGVDLLVDRLGEAKHHLPSSQFTNADGQFLPFPESSFDMILQFTAFSSVLDPKIKQQMAGEILRVLKSDGVILWYDFWLNPTNPQTAGIRLKEIRRLFLDCDLTIRKITLAPPIARRIAPCSRVLAMILETLTVFNSHYLVLIQKR